MRSPDIALILGAAIALSCSSTEEEPPACSEPIGSTSAALDYEAFGGPFMLNYCTGCHSSELPEGRRQDAPVAVNFDTLSGIRAQKDAILARAVHASEMPPAGGPSEEERRLLGDWLRCGAPSATEGFDPPPAPDAGIDPGPSGACAEPRQPLDPALLPRCSAETWQCVQSCPDLYEDDGAIGDCRDACVEADTTPAVNGVACNDCTFNQLLACAAANGCEEPAAELVCCITECITSGGGQTCFDQKCQGAIQAFGYCIAYGPIQCVSYDTGPLAECFARTVDGGI